MRERPAVDLSLTLSPFYSLARSTSIAPLITFRVLFGALMAAALTRFALNGWIHDQYIAPGFHFAFVPWAKALPAGGMYTVFAVLIMAALCIAVGFLFRAACIVFAVLFAYVELIDKTWYLNHYYLITLLAVLLACTPAGRSASLDMRLPGMRLMRSIPTLTLNAIKLQIVLVYFFAGIAKINGDWLLDAQPLRIWLHAKSGLPMIGDLLTQPATAYIASWAGMLFDVCCGFLLLWKRTAVAAWIVAAVFHTLTAILFPGIGMFPYVMILLTTVFLPVHWHERLWSTALPEENHTRPMPSAPRWLVVALACWFAVQIVVPLRHWLYPGKLFYNEEGYRFSWRVMLMEKAGAAFFTIHDPATDRRWQVDNMQYLNKTQDKQMCTQPDMLLQFAQHVYGTVKDSLPQAEVFCEAYVSVNGRGSRLLIDPKVDLAHVVDGWGERAWVIDGPTGEPAVGRSEGGLGRRDEE